MTKANGEYQEGEWYRSCSFGVHFYYNKEGAFIKAEDTLN